MTASEAIERIEEVLDSEYYYDETLGYQLTSDDFEWLEKAKQALEKQIPKKVTHEATLYRCCTCPTCKNVVDEFTEFMGNRCRVTPSHCKYCGQKLDWGEQEE